mmetsp:Transcript_52575/g.133550  ORF Transcript_52575/g.133550 Transcript_52575/m.133550 type:complete len:213 (-) Transcript_52575:32-670(-)
MSSKSPTMPSSTVLLSESESELAVSFISNTSPGEYSMNSPASTMVLKSVRGMPERRHHSLQIDSAKSTYFLPTSNFFFESSNWNCRNIGNALTKTHKKHHMSWSTCISANGALQMLGQLATPKMTQAVMKRLANTTAVLMKATSLTMPEYMNKNIAICQNGPFGSAVFHSKPGLDDPQIATMMKPSNKATKLTEKTMNVLSAMTDGVCPQKL